MRTTILKIAAAFAVVAASAAPAVACGGGGLFTSGGCAPCSQAYVNPCGQNYSTGNEYGGVAAYEQLPDPTPVTRQYYYVNQGPAFSGPGMRAPTPTYQETALGWRGYSRSGYGYGYRQRAYRAPVAYSYAPRPQYRARPSYRYGYSMQPRVRYGYAPRSYMARTSYNPARSYMPRMTYAPRAAARHHGYPQSHYRSQRYAY